MISAVTWRPTARQPKRRHGLYFRVHYTPIRSEQVIDGGDRDDVSGRGCQAWVHCCQGVSSQAGECEVFGVPEGVPVVHQGAAPGPGP